MEMPVFNPMIPSRVILLPVPDVITAVTIIKAAVAVTIEAPAAVTIEVAVAVTTVYTIPSKAVPMTDVTEAAEGVDPTVKAGPYHLEEGTVIAPIQSFQQMSQTCFQISQEEVTVNNQNSLLQPPIIEAIP